MQDADRYDTHGHTGSLHGDIAMLMLSYSLACSACLRCQNTTQAVQLPVRLLLHILF